MTCYTEGNLTICRTEVRSTRRLIKTCLDCKHRGRFALWDYGPWYGWMMVCGNCGRRWNDGEWMPFSWPVSDRQHNIASVKEVWA